MHIAVYTLPKNGHARMTCAAMVEGILTCGDKVSLFAPSDYSASHDFDAAVFWGYVTECQNIMKGYRGSKKPVVYLDLGYWKRETYYKVSVNGRHPTLYFQRVKHDSIRRQLFGVEPKPYRASGEYILIAGMGAKAAWAEGLEPVESFEKHVAFSLRRYTNRPIVYRPKPSWAAAKPIEGLIYNDPRTKLGDVLLKAHAVVSHHSNVCVDALVEGIPVFAWEGVASVMGLQDVGRIETPWLPDNREQWLNDVAYCQWSLEEMRNGACWEHLKSEGLLFKCNGDC